MSKFTLVLIAAVIAVAGVSTAQAQTKKAQAKAKDQATCAREVMAKPGYVDGRSGSCGPACNRAIQACMRGETF